MNRNSIKFTFAIAVCATLGLTGCQSQQAPNQANSGSAELADVEVNSKAYKAPAVTSPQDADGAVGATTADSTGGTTNPTAPAPDDFASNLNRGTSFVIENKNGESMWDGRVALYSPKELRIYARSIDAGSTLTGLTSATVQMKDASVPPVTAVAAPGQDYLIATLPLPATPPTTFEITILTDAVRGGTFTVTVPKLEEN